MPGVKKRLRLLSQAFVYEPSVYIADGVPVSTPLAEGNGFNIDKEAVISHITKKSHMIIVNSPNNSTGAVF